jgi:glycerol-3-phosphate dehydrogenase
VLVLGAGINGAAMARHLALANVPVCVVDAADLAGGATAASSRLIHGGLRYLEYGEFHLVRESLAERRRLLRLAPQFVHPLRLFIPVSTRLGGLRRTLGRFLGRARARDEVPEPRGLWLVGAGLAFYDRYAGDDALLRRSTHAVGEAGLPPVDDSRYRWLCAYSDAQITYPERFTIALLTEARRHAAAQRNWFRVLTYHTAALEGRKVSIRPTGLRVGGAEPGDSPVLEFEPAAIVNATGAWVDRTLERLHVPAERLMGGTKGSHFVTSNAKLRECLAGGGIYTEAADGRPVFLLPWCGGVLVGTTDLPFDGDPRDVVATDEEIDYLIDAANQVFPQVELTRGDVDLHYCGVRPLPMESKSSTAAISRSHHIEEHAEAAVPLFSLVGGKLTTARQLAEETVEVVLARLGIEPRCDTRDRVICGGEDYPQSGAELEATQQRVATTTGCTLAQVQAGWPLFGTRVESMLAGETPPAAATSSESVRGTQLPVRLVRRVIRDEWVRTLNDLVERRLMLLYDPQLSFRTLRHLAELLAEQGVADNSEIGAAADACAARLRHRYGKQVRGLSAQ